MALLVAGVGSVRTAAANACGGGDWPHGWFRRHGWRHGWRHAAAMMAVARPGSDDGAAAWRRRRECRDVTAILAGGIRSAADMSSRRRPAAAADVGRLSAAAGAVSAAAVAAAPAAAARGRPHGGGGRRNKAIRISFPTKSLPRLRQARRRRRSSGRATVRPHPTRNAEVSR